MTNIIVIVIIAFILGLAGGYVYRSKKKGKNCIGCPYSDSCSTSKNSSCSHKENN